MRSASGRWSTLRAPDDFAFGVTVESHGWFDLPPFRYDRAASLLEVAFHVERQAVAARIRPTARGLAIESEPRWARAAVTSTIASMLRLDEDLSALHARLATHDSLRWAVERKAGRLLRAATAFEDAVKVLCTTNCSWALTRKMVSSLVERLGEPAPLGLRTFPTAEAIASKTVRYLRDRIRCGYRAPYLREFARRVASGEIDPESWRARLRSAPGSAGTVRNEILSLLGFGPYSADNLLKLCGCYEHLGIDSWCRSTFAKLHGLGRPATDARLRRHYDRFGQWRGLAMWLELTRHWHEPGATPEWSGKGV